MRETDRPRRDLPLQSPDRRRLFRTAAALTGSLAAWPTLTLAGAAGPGANRLVLVILRGGLDGLGAAPALGDPDFAAARGPLGQYVAPPLRVDATFALHPSLVELHAMVGAAKRRSSTPSACPTASARTSTPSRCWRAAAPARTSSPPAGSAGPSPPAAARAWRSTPPCRWCCAAGPTSTPGRRRCCPIRRPISSPGWNACTPATRRWRRRSSGHASSAPTRRLAMQDATPATMAAPGPRPGAFRTLSRRAAEFLAQPNGPQAAVLEIGGWDTHANQANPNGPLAGGLRQLDLGLAALRSGLAAGGAWQRTVVVVASEFGREVAVNGTLGTDHGTRRRRLRPRRRGPGRPRRRRLAGPGERRSATKAATCASPPTCARC